MDVVKPLTPPPLLSVELVYEPEDDVVESWTVLAKDDRDGQEHAEPGTVEPSEAGDAAAENAEEVEDAGEVLVKIITPADVPDLLKDLQETPECVDDEVDLHDLVTEMEFVPEELETSMAEVCTDLEATVIEHGDEATLSEYAGHLIARDALDFNFYICDLGTVMRLYHAWRTALPRVRPFYAVKCMPDRGLIKTLCALGAGFDCATAHEVELAKSLGADMSRIILAHPQKMPREITRAAQLGANLTTFDTVNEVQKIAQANPSAKLVLRIRADDPGAQMVFGEKYGAEPSTWPALLQAAQRHNLPVVGVSFHVGSMATTKGAYRNAIERAKEAAVLASNFGHKVKLVDIGGGFQARFDEEGEVDMYFAEEVREALDKYFPSTEGFKCIAEPGRFFAEAPFVIATNVFGKRTRDLPSGGRAMDYWISDGIYGSMNCKMYDRMEINTRAIQDPTKDSLMSPSTGELRKIEQMNSRPTFPSTLYGPTCDGADKVVEGMSLPELNIGDWVLFFKFGAYTLAGAVSFNGFMVDQTSMRVFYVFSKNEKHAPDHAAEGQE